MKTTIKILFLLSLFSCTKAQPIHINGIGRPIHINGTGPQVTINNYMDIYIVSGQSNAEGRADSSALNSTYAYLKPQMVNNGNVVYIMNQTAPSTYNTYDTMQASVNMAASNFYTWGWQNQLSYQLNTYKNHDIYFLQNALGSAGIATWDSATSGVNWDSLTVLVNRTNAYASANNKIVRWKAFIWNQGETNAGATWDSTAYITAVRALFGRVRIKTGTPALPIVIVQGVDCQVLSNLASWQAAQAILGAETNNYLIAKTGTETCRDALHFTNATYVAKGTAIYDLIKNW